MVSFGNGKHLSLLTNEQQQGVILWTTIAFCPGIVTLSVPKLAVVSLLVRILDPCRFHKWFLWGIAIWCQLGFITAIGILLGQCKPMRALWDFSVHGICLDDKSIVKYGIYASGTPISSNLHGETRADLCKAYSAFVDIYLAVYPAIVLICLQISLHKELAPVASRGISSLWKKCALAVALGLGVM